MTDLVKLRRDGVVAVLMLNRPEKLNALSTECEDQLLAALTGSMVADAGSLVIHGEGRAFCAGADVTEFRGLDPASIMEYYRTSGQLYEVLADLPIPTVAAIHGYCMGGGFEMSLGCDVRVVEESAVFGLPEAALGILPSSGGLTRLVRMIGPARAKEVMLWHERLTASQANAYGLVTELVPDGASLTVAVAGAQRLAALPPLAVRTIKQASEAAADSSRSAALLIEQLGYAALAQTADANEAALAFEEKRKPRVTGR